MKFPAAKRFARLKRSPLRNRADDIPILVDHLVKQVAISIGKEPPTVSDEAIKQMSSYNWPGNVRELRNVLERAALLCNGQIKPEHLPAEISSGHSTTVSMSQDSDQSVLAQQEMALVVKALEENDWNQSAAARGQKVERRAIVSLGDSIAPLIDRFNADKEKVRFLTILSPS